jgi:type II secretory pathway component PulJ
MIAATLSTLVLAGVCSAFLTISRTTLNSSRYSEVEAETRRALETFGRDARRASNIHWHSDQSITLTLSSVVPDAPTTVSYAYDAVANSPTAGCFYQVMGDNPAAQPRTVLARGLSGISFQRFKLEAAEGAPNEAANDLETKQLRLQLAALRKGLTTMAASQSVTSACFILRNKRVSN